MKTIVKITFGLTLCFCFSSIDAQTEASSDITAPQTEVVTTFKRSNMNQVLSTTDGQSFSRSQLYNLPTRNVNKIANLVGGVQSYAGEIPRIRGAEPSGTAYFVDGMRVYGALPTAGY